MTYIPQPIEPISLAVEVITEVHKEIHEGSTFQVHDSNTIGSGSSQDYLITTPNTAKWAHMTLIADGTAVTSFFLYEGADRTGTALQTAVNQNRNSATAATTTIHKGTSAGTTDGTLIYTYASGTSAGNSRTGANTNHDEEIILKQNTKYIFRITSATNGNLCNAEFSWYEHTSGQM